MSEDKCPRCGAKRDKDFPSRFECGTSQDRSFPNSGLWVHPKCKDRQLSQQAQEIETLKALRDELFERLAGQAAEIERLREVNQTWQLFWEASPCDPDITPDQELLYQKLKDLGEI